ncbi:MAG: 16S rRNA (uracil(1498)-N(3))-methyltransferase [Melioribacteraceae bacterium]|nr:16S rRNA (uracil(1498)-N(3))-methyltransferase [Melioribacteraceae bacterium]
MNIIILTENDVIEKSIYKISDDRFLHIKNILKSEVGDVVEIGLLNSLIGSAEVLEISEAKVLLKTISFKEKIETSYKVDIICALPRPQTLKKVLNTCATMGVSNLYLIRSEKVEKSYFHSPLLNEANYSKYLREGLSQGKRTDLPKVSIHNKFKIFFENYFDEIDNNSICLLAHPNTENYLNKIKFENQKNIILSIGPEGGWNDFELNLMEAKGFVKFKLSENILRVENAVTAALSQIELVITGKLS